MYQENYLNISDEGEATIAIVPDGLPLSTTILPIPMISELKREKMIEEQKQCIWLHGCVITNTRRVKNPAFDKHDERTSTTFQFRPCKTKDEAEYVLDKIKQIGEDVLNQSAFSLKWDIR